MSRVPSSTAEPTRPKPPSAVSDGLEAVRAHVHGQDRVAVQLADLVPGELLLAEVVIVLRVFANDVGGEKGHVARGRVLGGIGFPARIGEAGLGHAELGGPLVHQLGEGFLGAGHAFGEHHRGVVAGLDDQPAQQVLDPHPALHREKHRRAVRVRPALAPGLLGDVVKVVEMKAALLQLAKDDLRRQELRGRGRRRRLVGVLLVEDGSAVVVLDQRDLGARREGPRLGRASGEPEAGDEQRDTEPERAHRQSSEATSRACRFAGWGLPQSPAELWR